MTIRQHKTIEEITNAPEVCIKAVYLTPSGMNIQPWYMEKLEDKICLHEEKLSPPRSLVHKLTDLDMGNALYRCALACRYTGRTFVFDRKKGRSDKMGYELFGEIALAR